MGIKINQVRVRKKMANGEEILEAPQAFMVGDGQVQNDEGVTVLKNLATEEDIDALFPTQIEES